LRHACHRLGPREVQVQRGGQICQHAYFLRLLRPCHCQVDNERLISASVVAACCGATPDSRSADLKMTQNAERWHSLLKLKCLPASTELRGISCLMHAHRLPKLRTASILCRPSKAKRLTPIALVRGLAARSSKLLVAVEPVKDEGPSGANEQREQRAGLARPDTWCVSKRCASASHLPRRSASSRGTPAQPFTVPNAPMTHTESNSGHIKHFFE